MIHSFSFDGRSCMEFGIVLEKAHRVLLPGRRQSFMTIPGRSGSRETSISRVYDDITVTCDCAYAATSMELLRRNAREAALWLSKKGELEFSDEPGKYYEAQIVGAVPLENDFRVGRFTLSFQCFPFAQSEARQAGAVITRDGRQLTITADGTAETPAAIRLYNAGAATVTNIKIIHRKEKS